MSNLYKDLYKISDFKESRQLTLKYSRNIWFGIGVISSHITARMVKDSEEDVGFYKTLDFILRIDQPYINKTGSERIISQSIKIVLSSKRVIEFALEEKLIRGDIISVSGMLIHKELPKSTGYNRTQFVELNNYYEHNINIIHKSKFIQEYEIYNLANVQDKYQND